MAESRGDKELVKNLREYADLLYQKEVLGRAIDEEAFAELIDKISHASKRGQILTLSRARNIDDDTIVAARLCLIYYGNLKSVQVSDLQLDLFNKGYVLGGISYVQFNAYVFNIQANENNKDWLLATKKTITDTMHKLLNLPESRKKALEILDSDEAFRNYYDNAYPDHRKKSQQPLSEQPEVTPQKEENLKVETTKVTTDDFVRTEAEAGDVEAQMAMADLYSKNNYVEKVRWYSLAAEQGRGAAISALYRYYTEGRPGIDKDPEKAEIYKQKLHDPKLSIKEIEDLISMLKTLQEIVGDYNYWDRKGNPDAVLAIRDILKSDKLPSVKWELISAAVNKSVSPEGIKAAKEKVATAALSFKNIFTKEKSQYRDDDTKDLYQLILANNGKGDNVGLVNFLSNGMRGPVEHVPQKFHPGSKDDNL